ETVLSGARQKARGVRTLDIAKRLIDFGFHPPTVYWPMLVEECMLIEPVETETRETLDSFAEAMAQIAEEIRTDPAFVHAAPHTAPVRRLDEVRAARQLDLRWRPAEGLAGTVQGGHDGKADEGGAAVHGGSLS
ncbi:MAG: aminomethyl-transferring glycine dehydrogenase subunit GcvPB, partial [Armatimonadetes bacterium]|nr:aminomethyl-transferring glycine dehydrogenase subunit GcvPB [Armatimonadota bacterium]